MARGQALLYPDRKRCLACRRYFGFLVVDGLYDSWECAPRGRPSDNPEDWPREHYVPLPGGVKREKHSYWYRSGAERAADRQGKGAYRCGYCRNYHIGTNRSEEK